MSSNSPAANQERANAAYLGVRTDMLAMIPTTASVHRVLDVGCAEGSTGATLKNERANCHVTGIELFERSAKTARTRLDEVHQGDAMTLLEQLSQDVQEGKSQPYDLVLCGDVLEHLTDPWAALRAVRTLCSGYAVISLPNAAHISTISAMLFGSNFPYRDRGIQDRTHLRFFGRKNLPELFAQAEFEEIKRFTHHRIIERPHRLNETLRPLLAHVPLIKGWTEYQFVSLLK